jgi:NitT/TauT family transport system permease protein
MASTANVAAAGAVPRARGRNQEVLAIRVGIIVLLVVAWELASASGLFYRDVVPSLVAVGRALVAVVANPEFYRHLGITLLEVASALAIGGALGLVVGFALGGSRFLAQAFEHYLYYLGPTPKIIFFPIMIMWFGVGPASKVAMGTLSCFFPIVLSVASGMRQIDPVLIRVGKSFKTSRWQTAIKIHLPAMRAPILNGVRLGLGVAIIGTLLAETKLSNVGVGFLIMQAYSVFDMPRMYAMLIVLFTLAIGGNALVGRLAGPPAAQRS